MANANTNAMFQVVIEGTSTHITITIKQTIAETAKAEDTDTTEILITAKAVFSSNNRAQLSKKIYRKKFSFIINWM